MGFFCRIVLPISVEKYSIGQLWSVAEASKNQTGGGEGVQVLINEPFDENRHVPPNRLVCNGKNFLRGQYSLKIYHMYSKVPSWLRMFVPIKSMELTEEAWNAYPYTRTVITNPKFMANNFYVIIETYHNADSGDTHNIHGLVGTELNNRKVAMIDVANDPVSAKDYSPDTDPCIVGCPPANRNPLPKDGTGKWMENNQWKVCKCDMFRSIFKRRNFVLPKLEGAWQEQTKVKPVMCCYKLVRIWFKWFGIQKKVETFLMLQEHRLFLLFHRQLICWQQHYHNLNMDDVRKIEDEAVRELERRRREEALGGYSLTDVDV